MNTIDLVEITFNSQRRRLTINPDAIESVAEGGSDPMSNTVIVMRSGNVHEVAEKRGEVMLKINIATGGKVTR